MVHKTRVWGVAECLSAAELAYKLTAKSWTPCTGFRLGDYLFLSDSFGGDSAEEFGVVHDDGAAELQQVESITFSWCTLEQARAYIEKALRGEMHEHCGTVRRGQLQEAASHGTCIHCA